MKDINTIYENIITSKKYNAICDELIYRICQETYVKYKKEKDVIKSVRTQLHAIYGAFFSDKCINQAASIMAEYDPEGTIKALAEELLNLHISSQERIATIEEFYEYIFSITGNPTSITDIGCAFNPFSIPYMNISSLKEYYALDIDKRLPDLINNYLKLLALPELASTIDIISSVPENYSDVTFLFKILPVIEHQKKGKTTDILTKINSKYIVVTFPTKSLSGRSKGMEEHYAQFVDTTISPSFNVISSNTIGNEYIVIIQKD